MTDESARVRDAVAAHTDRWTESARDIEAYLVDQVLDASHREIIGPVFPARGGSGVVHVAGREVARWGDPTVPEMAFSATKTVLSAVAGVAHDAGLLDPTARVSDVLDLPELDGDAAAITWENLLHQTSQWDGTLWGKPASVDAQSHREGTEAHYTCPVKPEYGYLWWLNDGRVPWPDAPATGRGARGNGSRHLLWVDPARELVLCSRWCEDVHALLAAVSDAVSG